MSLRLLKCQQGVNLFFSCQKKKMSLNLCRHRQCGIKRSHKISQRRPTSAQDTDVSTSTWCNLSVHLKLQDLSGSVVISLILGSAFKCNMVIHICLPLWSNGWFINLCFYCAISDHRICIIFEQLQPNLNCSLETSEKSAVGTLKVYLKYFIGV